ncbi:ribulose-phosphate 3-epimerase [Ruminococcus sp. AF18-22]|nr:ribulose-phosphate 3-epimerase [Ruminococcus sp. AF18-22]
MEKLLCPSMMCADYSNLKSEVISLENSGIDIFHLDVMDGHFVPNFGMGLQDIEYICSVATKPCDVHLMVTNPAEYIEKFAQIGCSIIYIHPETDIHPCRTLQKIHDLGVKAGIALNPGTTYETVEPLLYLSDYVMLMSVNPGFAGQKYIDFVTDKFTKFVKEAPVHGGYKVMIDGACSPERISELSREGVSGFVLGTSALFGKDRSYNEIIPELRAL